MKMFSRLSAALALSMSLIAPALAQFSSPSVAIISSAGIDAFAGSGIGSVLSRTSTGWKTLNCANGQVMLFQGVGTNAVCYTPTGTGTVTSVAATVPAFMTVSGGPVTAGGTLAFSFNSASANNFLASPSGSAGLPTMRAIVATDLPAIGGGDVSCTAGGNCTIAALAVTGAKMAAGTIGTAQIGASAGITGGQLAANTIANSNLAASGAATIKGNPTAAIATPSDFTIQGLADVSAPNATADWLPIYNAASGVLKKVNASELQTAVGGGVSSYNSRTGSVVPQLSDITGPLGYTPYNGGTNPNGFLSAIASLVTIGNPGALNLQGGVQIRFGTYTGTTDASGNMSMVYTAFSNATDVCISQNGDSGIWVTLSEYINGWPTINGHAVHATNWGASTPAVGTALRVNYVCFGH